MQDSPGIVRLVFPLLKCQQVEGKGSTTMASKPQHEVRAHRIKQAESLQQELLSNGEGELSPTSAFQ